jgi:hypothetical protein
MRRQRGATGALYTKKKARDDDAAEAEETWPRGKEGEKFGEQMRDRCDNRIGLVIAGRTSKKARTGDMAGWLAAHYYSLPSHYKMATS